MTAESICLYRTSITLNKTQITNSKIFTTMKKIKLFSLVAATLFAGSTMAQTTTIFNASDAGWSATGVDLTTGATTVGKVTWNGRKSASIADGSKTFEDNVEWTARLKFGGKSEISTSKMTGVFSFDVEKAGTVKVYCVGGGSGDRTTYISQTITSTTNDATTAIGSFKSTDQVIGIATAQVEAGAVYVWADNNVGVYGITFEASAPVTEPWIAFSKEDVSLKVTPFVAKAEAELTLKGGNLTAGTTYDLSLPTVTGLTITPTSVTVAKDGTLNDTITLSYTSKVNVEAASTKLALNIGELTASTTINYSANVDLLTQTIVTDSTTWDWSKAGATTIQFTDASVPTKNDTILLANVDGIANSEEFNSQALLVNGEYMIRDSKFFQGGYISFNAERKGFVTVNYSNTGGNAARSLVVNGTKDAAVSSADNKTEQTSSKMSVNAGKVVIMFAETADETNATKYARVYSITYTVDKSGDIGAALNQVQAEVKAVKVIRDGQLLIIREGKTYTAQGVELQ